MGYFFTWYTFFSYTLFIVFISFLPVKVSWHVPLPLLDKILHCLMYFLLSFIATNTFILKKKLYPRAFSLSYAFLLGLIIEVIQFFLPFRSFESLDILSNFIGSFLGCLLRIV